MEEVYAGLTASNADVYSICQQRQTMKTRAVDVRPGNCAFAPPSIAWTMFTQCLSAEE